MLRRCTWLLQELAVTLLMSMVQAIAALRAKASGAYDDVGITNSMGGALISAGDPMNSIAYSRTPAQARSQWRCPPAWRAMSRVVHPDMRMLPSRQLSGCADPCLNACALMPCDAAHSTVFAQGTLG